MLYKKRISIFITIMIIMQLVMPASWDVRAEETGLESSWRISFQPKEVEPPYGYIPDYGELYGSRHGGHYGWNNDVSTLTVQEATYGSEDSQTYVRFGKGDIWEIELNTGFYDVSVTVGDAVYSSTNTIWIEGITFFEQENLAPGETATQTKNILVSDGKLTLDQGEYEDGFTSLQQIEIVKTAEWLPPDTDELILPSITKPIEARTATGNKVLISGKMNNPHNSPPYLSLVGLDDEINIYMTEQIHTIEGIISTYMGEATSCLGCDERGIQQQILNSSNDDLIVIYAGHLNLNEDTRFGSVDKPAVVIVDGINTNKKLNLEVFGTLIIRNHLNANQGLSIRVQSSEDHGLGDLWVQGNLHLNNDSNVEISGQLYAEKLMYNNGDLRVDAQRILVADQMHINTNVNMYIQEEMVLGKLVSNNEQALLKVIEGDLFIRDNVNINNHLVVETGGWFAVGGNMIANKRPIILTGTETGKGTLLKFKLYGLLAEYFSEPSFTGDRLIKVDERIDMNQPPNVIDADFTKDGYAVSWTGQIQARFSETYTFSTKAKGGVRLWINDQLLIDSYDDQMNQGQGTISLLAGQRYNIKMEYYTNKNTGVQLFWESLSQSREIVPQHRLHPFAVPTSLQTVASETALTLSWNPVPNASFYDVEVDGQVLAVGQQPIFLHNSLLPGTVHEYRVRAVHDDIIGEWTKVLTSWTLPDVITEIRMSSTKDSIRLDWEPVLGATGYDIEVDHSIVDNGDKLYFELTGLNPNIQKAFRIRAKNSSGTGKWTEVLVESTGVGVPHNLSGIPSDTSISLSWDAVSGADSYDLEIDGEIITGLFTTMYLHENVLPNSEYTYRVRAKNKKGAGNWSDSITINTLPSTPMNIQAIASNTEIVLTWDEVSGAVGYELEVDGKLVDNGNLTEFHHVDLSANTEHVYRVRARNSYVSGHWSDPVTVVTLAGIPSNLQAVATSTSISLTWNGVIGANGYDLEVDGLVINIGLRTNYEHEGLEPLSEYRYRVRARSRAGIGDWSEYVYQKTTLGQPEIRVTNASPTTITLEWNEVSGALSYDLMVDGQVIQNVDGTVFIHENLSPNSYHYYRVRARNGANTGDWSEAVSLTTQLGTPVISSIIAQSRSIWLKWETVVGAESYELEVDGQLLEMGNVDHYLHSGLQPNSRHTYRVRAKNSSGYSAWSEWSTAVTQSTPPDVPRNVEFEADTNSITITWTAVLGAHAYEVEVDGIIRSGLSTNTYRIENLESNTMHVFRIRSIGIGGSSGWTELYQKSTVPEITVNVGKDTIFNFAVVVPAKPNQLTRQITVTFNPEDVEVIDLYALTPEAELQTGRIEGTNYTIVRFDAGKIVYMVDKAENTIFNLIKFRAKKNEYTKITYTVD